MKPTMTVAAKTPNLAVGWRVGVALTVFVLLVAGASAIAQGLITAGAPVARYNEAVRFVGGKRTVEMPAAPTKVDQAAERGLWEYKVLKPGSLPENLLEHPDGPMDCSTRTYFRETCRPTDYGRIKRLRSFIVKFNGQWQQCIGIDTPNECMPLWNRAGPQGQLRAPPIALF